MLQICYEFTTFLFLFLFQGCFSESLPQRSQHDPNKHLLPPGQNQEMFWQCIELATCSMQHAARCISSVSMLDWLISNDLHIGRSTRKQPSPMTWKKQAKKKKHIYICIMPGRLYFFTPVCVCEIDLKCNMAKSGVNEFLWTAALEHTRTHSKKPRRRATRTARLSQIDLARRMSS